MNNPFSKISQLKAQIYHEKVFAFQDLTIYIQNHKEYNPENKWKTLEIVSKFHEIVLMVKFILAKGNNKLVETHKELEDEISLTQSDKFCKSYAKAKKIARLARYEELVLSKEAIEKFEQAYEFFLNEFKIRKDDA
jgi:ERCC4-related helicase